MEKYPTKNQKVIDWVQSIAKITEPDEIYWCDGTEKEKFTVKVVSACSRAKAIWTKPLPITFFPHRSSIVICCIIPSAPVFLSVCPAIRCSATPFPAICSSRC